MVDIVAGERPRMDALVRDVEAIKARGMAALQVIEASYQTVPLRSFRGW